MKRPGSVAALEELGRVRLSENFFMRDMLYSEIAEHWQALAWWVHDHLPNNGGLTFFSKLAAFNISWHERGERSIFSYAAPKGWLTKPGMENFEGSHADESRDWIDEAGIGG